MAYVTYAVDGTTITGVFANPQPFPTTQLADTDPTVLAFLNPAPVPTCHVWQIKAALTSAQLATINSAIAGMNNPALTEFFNQGDDLVPANSSTLLALGAILNLTPTQVASLVQTASLTVIP